MLATAPANRDGSPFALKRAQAEAVLAWDTHHGLFAPVGVGRGKTLITLLTAAHALRQGYERVALFVPSEVYSQLTRTDIGWSRHRIDLNIPFHLLGGKEPADRKRLCRSGKRGCYILPYTCLSNRDAWDVMFEWLKPQVLILDEAHRVKNIKDSARARRMQSYLQQFVPRVAVLSGTITKKSMADYHHLITAALHGGCPVPIPQSMAEEWAQLTDAGSDPGEAQAGPLKPLRRWAESHFPAEEIKPGVAGYRRVLQLRLSSAPGVVSTGDTDIGVSLRMRNEAVVEKDTRPGWAVLQEHMRQLEDNWITPSGDEIDCAMHLWAYRLELSAGLYYHKLWPSPETLHQRKGWSLAEAQDMLGLGLELHEAKQTYHKMMRWWLSNHFTPRMDTPRLVGLHMSEHRDHDATLRVPDDMYRLWLEVKRRELPGLPERDSIPVRVCDYKVNQAVKWARRIAEDKSLKTGGIIWGLHREFTRWVHEALVEADLPALHGASESEMPGSNDRVLDHANTNKFMSMSLPAHHVGKNLQHHTNMLFGEWPREADLAEQAIGRIHREGQDADELVISRMDSSDFDTENFCSCLVDALYLTQCLGHPQKVIYADYEELPKLWPSGFLRERGFENRSLTVEEEDALRERFTAV